MTKISDEENSWEHKRQKIHPYVDVTREELAKAMILSGDDGLFKNALRFKGCGERYNLHKCDSCSNIEVKGSRCESRLCPECGKKRMNKLIAQNDKFLFQLSTNPHGKRRATLLTLTFKNIPYEDYCRKDYERATKCFNQFLKHPKIKGKIYGGIYTIETKRPSKGYVYRSGYELDGSRTVNLHIHALIDAEYLHQAQIKTVWREITGDSFIVDIRTVKASIPSLKEVLKYSIAPPNMGDADSYVKFMKETKGLRLFNTFGTFRKRFQLTKKTPHNCSVCKVGLMTFITEMGRKEALRWQELKKGSPFDIYGRCNSVGIPGLIGIFPEYGDFKNNEQERCC